MEKTQYRSRGSYLEYLTQVSWFWGLIKFESWERIPRPYKWEFGLNGFEWDNHVSNHNENFEVFIEKYPDIRVYLEEYKIRQAELDKETIQEEKEREKEREKIKYF